MIKSSGYHVRLEAPHPQRETIAVWLDIPEVYALCGAVRLHLKGSILTVSGDVRGRFARICGASLEMFEEVIEETFSFELSLHEPAYDDLKGRGEIETPGDLDAPDYWPDEVIDLGDILVQQASLAMAAHPRKSGAVQIDDLSSDAPLSPFAALKGLLPEKDS